MQRQQEELTKGIAITAVGAGLMYWSMTQPCNIAPNPTIGLSVEMSRMMCLSSDPKLMILLLLGSAALFTGAGRLFKNI